jgi:hypothetical protein
MYLVVMDQLARDDVAAAAAVHRELGPDYDRAVAEGLIERIGEEIDKRVDARLRQSGDRPAERAGGVELSPAARSSSWAGPIILGLGSIAVGGVVSATALRSQFHGPVAAHTVLVGLIWIIIAIINIAYARRR